MFRFHKPRNIITLFHAPSSPTSQRVLTLLKTASAHASETATEDQASDHSHHDEIQKTMQDFDLDVTEEEPTSDQRRTIAEYLEAQGAGKGFERPMVVDWNNGKAVAGENESEILKLLGQFPKDKS